jgi:ABC-type Fe3+-siderophore transport system permease subunit
VTQPAATRTDPPSGSIRRPALTRARVAAWTGALLLVLAACLLAGASLGAGRVTLLDALAGRLGPADSAILFEVRVPRVLLAAVLGGALTVAGVVFQALLRNPLADPYVLGVSGGASVGAVVALIAGFGASGGRFGGIGGMAVPALAFAGALGALLLIERLATVEGRLNIYTILLTGAVFNAFSAALIFFLQSVASFEELHAIVFQLMGQVPGFGYREIAALAATTGLGAVALFAMARDFNALSLGEEAAAQLGVDVERVKRRTFVLGSLLTALAVSVAGLIGFVGLVVPHLLRLVLGPDHRLLLPAGLLGGAAFLVVADLAARTLAAPTEIPVGVVTALIGGPFFLYLLRRRRGGHGFG